MINIFFFSLIVVIITTTSFSCMINLLGRSRLFLRSYNLLNRYAFL
nr:MAG TPA: hypothetical protein [Caudoviricetes sp.]DAU00955.1 MAG TPA: hypothetical protein [Caudoviricetes sp.]